MTDYLIVNASAGALTNVNAGGDDVAAGTISGAVALDSTELEDLLALDDQIGVIPAGGSLYQVGSLMLFSEFEGDGLYVEVQPDMTSGVISLDPAGLAVALGEGKMLVKAGVSDETRRLMARAMNRGGFPERIFQD